MPSISLLASSCVNILKKDLILTFTQNPVCPYVVCTFALAKSTAIASKLQNLPISGFRIKLFHDCSRSADQSDCNGTVRSMFDWLMFESPSCSCPKLRQNYLGNGVRTWDMTVSLMLSRCCLAGSLAVSFSTPLRWGVDMQLNVRSLLDVPPVMMCVVSNKIGGHRDTFLCRARYSYGANAVGIEPSIFCQLQFYNPNIIGLWHSLLVSRVGRK